MNGWRELYPRAGTNRALLGGLYDVPFIHCTIMACALKSGGWRLRCAPPSLLPGLLGIPTCPSALLRIDLACAVHSSCWCISICTTVYMYLLMGFWN